MASVSRFKTLGFLILAMSACANEEDKQDSVIAVEAKVFDITIQSQLPDSYEYQSESALVGQTADGHETRMLLAIPDILSLFQEDVVLSSIAHIEIQMVASEVAVNPENIRLGFMSRKMTPYSTWNSRFSLAPDQEWDTPGGDLMDLPAIAPDIEKAGVGVSHKKLLFNVTDTIIAAIGAGVTIESFLLQVLPSEDNAENSSRFFTSNYSHAYSPKAILTFNKEDILIP
ncbi:hypothetical protein [Oligoflexus tunisiensis]|uniref:hypothetical protein n=1 Tax=Oligoflexus tunisiensis TaxID=708132 RepID=UPI00114D1F9F|nr:hypothetical protein [Oligoflexus tunisiensis]